MRTLQVIDALKDKRIIPSDRQFALKIGIDPTQISQARNGKREIPDKYIDKIVNIFGISQAFLNAGVGEMFTQVEDKMSTHVDLDANRYVVPASKAPNSNAILIGEVSEDHDSSPFIDIGGGQYIMVVPLVPIRAQASYVEHYNDEQFLNENFTQKHSFAVSRMYRGRYMAFIVDGESMDNGIAGEAIPEGYTVTGREIQKQHWRNKFHIHRYKDYIIVHKEGIFVKQITKHDTENGVITCHSLNPDKDQYFDFDLNLDECYQIFNVVNVTQTK